MLILGLNAFHADSAACLVRDGKLVAAAEEERFRRIKHWAGYPSHAIEFCLKQAGVTFANVDHVAVNQDSRANLRRKLTYLATGGASLELVRSKLRNRQARAGVPQLLARQFSPGAEWKAQFHDVEHHLAHLSSAFRVSPFENAVVVSVDGFGDFASAAWGVGDGTSLSLDDRIYFPHSLGTFYEALTQYLGFRHYGDEYKVMGLAPYGEPAFLNEMRRIVQVQSRGRHKLDLSYFIHHFQPIAQEWNNGPPVIVDLFSPRLEELLGARRRPDEPLTQRHKDIARSVQTMYEEAFFHLINHLQEEHRLTDIALAGGCAANSVANGKISRMTKFRRVYVHAAPGDAGGAIGAAFQVWHKLGGERSFVMDHALWGPEFHSAEIDALIGDKRAEVEAAHCAICVIPDEAELCRIVASEIARGAVVGWFQGRMEWGPRALGNRSIVCDPRRGDMKQILNAKIKRRESFRPFAPSILDEHTIEWFEENDHVPFMMQVFQIREEKRSLIPAVTHVDGSGRLQTVTKAANPRYYRLIEAFRALTGIPMVLNTSFNENEPVVCRPEEALDCFLRTRMDVLVLGNTLIQRSDNPVRKSDAKPVAAIA